MDSSLPSRLLLVVLLCAPAALALAAEPQSPRPAREMNFTGPLVSGGPPVPAGTLIVQPYLVQTQTIGRYDSDGQRRKVDNVADDWRVAVPITYGITERFTVGATLRGVHARTLDGDRRWAAGDTSLSGQYLLYSGASAANPTLAVSVHQNMPTGRHDQLDRLGLADATGSGASFTSIGFTGQAFFLAERNLRMRLNLSYRLPGAGVTLRGRSGYGTTGQEHARANLGSAFQAVVGAEYSFNSNWVLAGDLLYEREQGARLHYHAQTEGGLVRHEGRRPDSWRLSVAPALEYHPSSRVGIIGGVLVSLDGRNAAQLLSPQLSVLWAF
ncbi:MAG TPA: hypothetical protein VM687_13310 [Stenotrophomonas sp.]|nr:hypothetical protein [Stenotrophomonas sp.]